MARTGYKIYVCLDDNPNSPTYMQTYTERVEDQTDCPVEVDDLILVSNECEVTLTGKTGYRILIYYNRGTGEYTEVREEDEECIPSSTDEQWVASGDPYCETTTAGTNTGYMIQVEVQRNIELPNYGEIRYDRYKSPECGANDCAIWEEVSRSCHITINNCATTFDGTADVIQIDVSPLSSTYNQTRTVNVEDSNCDNCTNTTFQWTYVGDFCGDDDIICENGITGSSSGMPRIYTQIEYIQNPSTAYVDTGFKPNQNTRIEIETQVVEMTYGGRQIGAGGYDRANAIQFDFENEHEINISWGGYAGWVRYVCSFDFNRHYYIWDGNEFWRDKDTANEFYATTAATDYQCTDNLGIFTRIQAGYAASDGEYMRGRVFSFKMYDNGTLIRDFIPVIRTTDSTFGFYDLVNGTFYTSATNTPLTGGTIS